MRVVAELSASDPAADFEADAVLVWGPEPAGFDEP